MFHSAEVLSNEEAGGHGDRWGVFSGGFDTAVRKLVTTVEKAEMFDIGLVDASAKESLLAAGEPWGTLLLYTGMEQGVSRNGAMSVIGQKPGAQGNKQLWSAYPFFGDGVEVNGVADCLRLHPNRLEATLEIELENEAPLHAFDPLFCLSRALYRSGEIYRFSISALAYAMEPAQQREYVIDDPDKIRRFRAEDAWVKKHGQYSKQNEAAALDAWHLESPEDLEPIHLRMDRTTMLLPGGFSDDYGYMGEVVEIAPDAVRLFDTNFWRVKVTLIRDQGFLFTVPVFVAENLFEGDWRPSVGEYVTGGLWMQAYVKSRR